MGSTDLVCASKPHSQHSEFRRNNKKKQHHTLKRNKSVPFEIVSNGSKEQTIQNVFDK